MTVHREAVILIRIDNMDALATEGQRSVRFPLADVGDVSTVLQVDAAVEAALKQAPPVAEWDRL